MGDDVVLQFVHFRPQKPTRARTEDRKHGDLLRALTVDIVTTYSSCSSGFGYSVSCAPRRVLTKLSKGVHNCGHDNADNDYICRVGDKLSNPDGQSYEILERLGHGTFGQVLKCNPSSGGQPIALKIIKNKPAYFHQALVEVRILQMLNQDFDPDDEKRIVRMLDFFVYRKHLCIAFELLSVNLYDVLKQNSFRGVSISLIRVLTEQLLKAMKCLREAFVIHCDLKPENVLLSNMQHAKIKLIDFGSACFEKHSVYSYIQSRFYRSPEVLLSLPYTSAIDMWSLGCICAELFLGLPIFPGHSEYDQVCRIVEVLGCPPTSMLDMGKNTRRYFRRVEEMISTADGDDGSEAALEDEQHPARAARAADRNGEEHARGGDERDHGVSSRTLPASGQGHSDTKPDREDSSAPEVEPSSRARHSEEGVEAARDPAAAAQQESSPPATEPDSDSGTQARETMPRSESLLDLLKRKFNMQPASDDGISGTNTQAARVAQQSGLFGSLSRNKRATAEGFTTSEGCLSAGSTLSTAADTSEVSVSLRRALSSDELVPRDGSSDGRGDPRASGSSDGGRARAAAVVGAVSDASCCQQTRRCRIVRKGVRTFWRLKTREEFERDEHKKEPTPKKYFNFKSLEQMIELVPYKNNQSQRSLKDEQEGRLCFLQFLWGVLQINPDERWTPKQAAQHPFITHSPYDPDFQPPADEPVPSFTRAPLPARAATGLLFGAVAVPRLDPEAMSPSAPTGGGSARTVHENAVRQRGAGSSMDAEQPRSAPASTRGLAPAVRPVVGGKNDVERELEPQLLQGAGLPEAPATIPDPAMRGIGNYLCVGIPLPDDNLAESYRPPIDKMSEDFFRSVARSRYKRGHNSEQASHGAGSPQKARNGAWSVSTGASFCSSASSTGSTPTGGRGRRGIASPYSVGSPLSTSGAPIKSHYNAFTLEPKAAGPASSRQQLSGSTSSPHGSAVSAAPVHSAVGAVGTGGVPAQTPHRGTGPSSGAPLHGRTGASRDGSRGSSPWHLPSPMSEISTSDNNRGSSQPSGSDSCGENPLPHCIFNECRQHLEDSHSDTAPHWPRSTQVSDSDCTTPRSHDAAEQARPEEERGNTKDPQYALWENIKSEITRTGLTRRLDITQSPGSTGAMGNFREAMGMKESGPVIPHGLGARRDALSSMLIPHASEYEHSTASSGVIGPAAGHSSPLPRTSSGAESSHLGLGGATNAHHYHSRRKGRRHQSGNI